MRYIAVSCLREGMRLARPLYRNADTMLASGVVLTEQYINSIQRCGFSGVYIDDALSADIELETMISDELRHETARSLSKIIDIVIIYQDSFAYIHIPPIIMLPECNPLAGSA